MSEDSEKKEANSEEKPIHYGWARYIGGHIAYPKSEEIGVYFYNDRFSIWFTKRESWLIIPLLNIVHMENSYEKKHTYTKIQFKENSGEQYVVIDFEKGIEIAQNFIYNKMQELKENTTLHEHSEHSQPKPSIEEESKPSIVEESKPSIVEESKPSIVTHLPYKSPGTSALIAFIGGLVGLQGIGHIYVGKVGRGIGILLLSLFLYVIAIILLITYPPIGLILIIGYVIMFIWQIFSARKLARKFNESVRTTNKEPW